MFEACRGNCNAWSRPSSEATFEAPPAQHGRLLGKKQAKRHPCWCYVEPSVLAKEQLISADHDTGSTKAEVKRPFLSSPCGGSPCQHQSGAMRGRPFQRSALRMPSGVTH